MNTLNKIIGIIVISFWLPAASGCADSNIHQDKGPEEMQVTAQQENQSSAPKPADAEESDKIEIKESDKIPGWNKLKTKVSLNELTEHGSQPIDDSEEIGFSIHFPGNWTINSSVFHDGNNKKVGEIPPAVFVKSGQESAFLEYKPAIDQGEELISSEKIQVNSYEGAKIITKIQTEAGYWYPHIYRLTDETHGFTIVFYSEVLNKEDQALFDRIVNTFQFE